MQGQLPSVQCSTVGVQLARWLLQPQLRLTVLCECRTSCLYVSAGAGAAAVSCTAGLARLTPHCSRLNRSLCQVYEHCWCAWLHPSALPTRVLNHVWHHPVLGRALQLVHVSSGIHLLL